MRRITWILVIVTALLWIAIAIYWTGTGTSQPNQAEDTLLFPVPTETPTPPFRTQSLPTATESALIATPSASPTPAPSINIVSPTVGLRLDY